MYKLINRNVANILGNIRMKEVKTYSELLGDLNGTDVSKDEKYRRKYRAFWNMRFPSDQYREAYFEYLQTHKESKNITPKTICQELKEASVDEKRNYIIQFSFATKLAHMLDQTVPIYDSMVSTFFFLRNPKRGLDFDERLRLYSNSHEFLKREYKRVIDESLLQPSIRAFRQKFQEYPQDPVKIIDWLIWAFVSLASEGRFLSGKFQHE